MDDTISRKAAIDAIKNLCEECNADYCGECRIDHPDKDAKSVLEALPSADEPSQVARDIARIVENEQDMRVIAQSEKRTETHACDYISRNAAIDAITHELSCGAVVDQCGLETAYDLIKELPPVELERKSRPCDDAISRREAIKKVYI